MNKKYLFFIILILSLSVMCKKSNGKEKTNKINNIKKKKRVGAFFVQDIVKKPFESYKIESKKAKEIIDKYFNSNNYKVIWNCKLGKNKMKIYFAVEEEPKLYKGIKRGIIVREDGVVKAYFEPDKGVYTPERKIIDFNRIGFNKNEVGYFILTTNGNTVKYYADTNKGGADFTVLLADKKYNAITNPTAIKAPSAWFFYIGVLKEKSEDIPILFNYETEHDTEEKSYKRMRKRLKQYRESMKKNIKVKTAALKTEFKRLKKAGLVEEG